jgi:hypothetical protein
MVPSLPTVQRQKALLDTDGQEAQEGQHEQMLLDLLDEKACITGTLDVTLEEAQEKRNEAHKQCLEAKKFAPAWHRDHLQGLADASAEFHQEKPAQVLKNLHHWENIRRKAQRVRALSKNQKDKNTPSASTQSTVSGLNAMTR